MAATVALALVAVFATAAANAPGSCPGPTLAEAEARLPVAEKFLFSGAMLPPFIELWREAEENLPRTAPDSATVLARPGAPYAILFGRQGCALGLLQASPPDLFRMMRTTLGPAV